MPGVNTLRSRRCNRIAEEPERVTGTSVMIRTRRLEVRAMTSASPKLARTWHEAVLSFLEPASDLVEPGGRYWV